jgi:hypothetical protein
MTATLRIHFAVTKALRFVGAIIMAKGITQRPEAVTVLRENFAAWNPLIQTQNLEFHAGLTWTASLRRMNAASVNAGRAIFRLGSCAATLV